MAASATRRGGGRAALVAATLCCLWGHRCCGLTHGRDAEFERLTIDHTARRCEPAGRSSRWSCVRPVSAAEVAGRDPTRFGFQNEVEAQNRRVGDVQDNAYADHISLMPRFTKGPGFKLMRFTDKIWRHLVPLYAQMRVTAMEEHPTIPGAYTNIDAVPMGKINLHNYPDTYKPVVAEMHDILQWWSQMKLKHSTTFGIRVYRRNSMLINHVDRSDTHILSAVLQVAQHGIDEDGGWPLEFEDDAGNIFEVYLQPGQMVLYEGGHFRHGRPMRLRGEEFANLFSHFMPPEWRGPYQNAEL